MTFADNSVKTNWRFIGIATVLTVLIAGGFFVFLSTSQKEEGGQPVTLQNLEDEEQKLAEEVVRGYGDALLTRDRNEVLVYLTGEAKEEVQQWSRIFGTSNPRLESFEIVSSKPISPTEFEFRARKYQEYTGEGRIGYNDEIITVGKSGEVYLIYSVDRREYVALLNDDVVGWLLDEDLQNWSTYRNEEFVFELKYPSTFLEESKEEGFIGLVDRSIGRLLVGSFISDKSFTAFADDLEEFYEYKNVKRYQVEIAGHPAVSLEVLDNLKGIRNIETYINAGRNTIVEIQTFGFISDYEAVKQLHQKILSTFRFLDLQDSEELRRKKIFGEEDIPKLLSPQGRYFIQLAEFTTQNLTPSDFYSKFQFRELPEMLEEENVKDLLQKVNDNTDLFTYFIVSQEREGQGFDYTVTATKSIFLGPFDTQDSASSAFSSLSQTFPDATVDRGLPSGQLKGVYRSKDGFILYPFQVFNGVDYVVDKENQRLFVIDPGGFEFEKFPDTLWIIDGKRKEVTSVPGVNGMVLLPDKVHLLIPRYFSVEKTEGVDEERLREVAEEIGVSIDIIRENIYGLGGKPVLGTFALFKFNVETGEEKSLQFVGGRGGIFMLDTGEIFITNHGNVGFSKGPYFRFDPESENFMLMPNDFEPDFDNVVQPLTVGEGGDFEIIAAGNKVKLIRFDGLYIEGRIK